jgi:two-component system, NtrC family, response regulator GlrR
MTGSRTPTLILGSDCQHELLERLSRIAQTDAEILITGPTGVGKELYALHAHGCSRRRDGPFVVANCSNLGGDLLENEIFGHARGAYTGAHAAGEGLASAAQGGTLFLDEVDSLPPSSQAKLLRFIQQREYRRLGETFVRRADLRFIAACNADLPALVRGGHFRSDLYFRLHVAPIAIPPLAERPGDIAPLIAHFVAKSAEDYGVDTVVFAPSATQVLLGYRWPGNVRELENLVRYLTCLQLGRPVEAADLEPLGAAGAEEAPPALTFADRPLKEAKGALIVEFERLYLDQALGRANGNIAEAARQSGKHRRAFFELMRKYGMTGEGAGRESGRRPRSAGSDGGAQPYQEDR